MLLLAHAASAQEPQGRPGVIRSGSLCLQTTDIPGNSHEVPCVDRYKEGEEIAFWEDSFKTRFEMNNSPRDRLDWEAWQASAASGATTLDARLDAFDAEQQKQAEQHADVSKPFLHGMCESNDEKEQNNKEVLQRGCKRSLIDFQLDFWFALQGDHGAQMGVAGCFENGAPLGNPLFFQWPCHRVVSPDETVMCAWYLVAASSGHPKSAEAAERYGYVYECDKKAFIERQVILGTASELFLRIYKRPLPLAR